MSQQCRACLNRSPSMRFMGEINPETQLLLSMYSSVINFEWLQEDNTTSYLCHECENSLRMSYEFREKCLRSQEIIRVRLEPQKRVDTPQSLENPLDSSPDRPNLSPDVIIKEGFEIGAESLEREASLDSYCHKCEKRVTNLSAHARKFHSNTKGGLKRHVCPLCTKELKTAPSLKAHLQVHDGSTPHKCSYCGKPHKNRGQLVEHERTHTGEKPHVCNVCGKGFAQKGALHTHMKIHTGRPEVCGICEKRFCRPSELKLHLRKHSGEKPFLCTECGKAFIQRSHLMEHMQTHSDVRPFGCVYCDKAFKQKSLLTSHLQIHSGYKPFQCKFCEYACLRPYRLHQHMKLHNANTKRDKDHLCPVCEKGFTSQAMLNSHVTTSHNAIL